MNKLVSIVSPCYNGENYIERYIKAIIDQTYRPLELILVNDGSTDKTNDIVSKYIKKIENSGIIFKYIYQENKGPGAAINNGLKSTEGDYLIWPDTDDFLYPESIRKRVAFLEEQPEFGFVYSDGETYFENDLVKSVSKIKAFIPKDGYMFKNFVTAKAVYTPCGYMVRMDAFLDVNAKKEIFPSRYGQNIQMLLPISYKHRCGYLKECLYGRVDREGSLSKKVWIEGEDAWQIGILGLSDIFVETLKSIGGDALAYIPFIKYKDLRMMSATAKNMNKKYYKLYRNILWRSTKLILTEVFKVVVKG